MIKEIRIGDLIRMKSTIFIKQEIGIVVSKHKDGFRVLFGDCKSMFCYKCELENIL